jgi:pilus assembly protein Flp/PilA
MEGGKMFGRMFVSARTWMSDLRTRAREERGATAVEYALMVALIAAVIILAVTALGNNAATKFSDVASAVGAS